MQFTQSFPHHTFYPNLPPDESSFISNKITTNYQKKLKNESIEECHTLKLKKNQNIVKRPIFNQPQAELKRKHCVIKPMKSKISLGITKLSKIVEEKKNFTVKQKQTEHYPNLFIKRNGCTAPMRHRLKSQNNKQNHQNHEEKQIPQSQQKQPMQSVSSIFHYRSKSKLAKLSNLMKIKSKPHMIFCASKLPKDFFGESIENNIHQLGHEYKFLPVNLNELNEHNQGLKKCKLTSSVKLLNEIRKVDLVRKLHFDEEKIQLRPQLNQKNDGQFTFRRQKSRKVIQIIEDNKAMVTPNFEKDHPHLQSSTSKPLQTPVMNYRTVNNIQESNKKLYRNHSRQLLKL